MPRKSRAKTKSPDPTPIAEILPQTPAAQMLAAHDARSEIEPDQPMAEHEAVAAFQRQRERDQAVNHVERVAPERVPSSFAEAVRASKSAFLPIPEGFLNVDSFPAAGLKVNRSRDRKVVALQFSEDRLPIRAEKDILEAVSGNSPGFGYKTARRQWERYDGENPGGNLIDAKRLAADLAKEREGLGR